MKSLANTIAFAFQTADDESTPVILEAALTGLAANQQSRIRAIRLVIDTLADAMVVEVQAAREERPRSEGEAEAANDFAMAFDSLRAARQHLAGY